MATITLFSALAGLIWSVIAVLIMGGNAFNTTFLPWMVAGVVAGIAAGKFTIWSRARKDGGESLGYGLATYYLGMLIYWGSFVILQRLIMCVQAGCWTDFNLYDHLILIVWFIVLGTAVWGVLLIPLTFLTRHLIWQLYLRKVD